MREVANQIYEIDVNYLFPKLTSCYLAVSEAGAVLIDNGGKNAVAAIEAALSRLGIAPEQVVASMISHVHLDHMAVTGELARRFPNMRVYIHPQGSKHIIDPEAALYPAVRALYGSDFCRAHYGDLVPIDEARVMSVPDGEICHFGAQEFHCFHTPGHAWHHMSFFEANSKIVFAGDAYGISFTFADHPIYFPVCPPSQFNEEAMRASYDKVLAYQPAAIAVSHFGIVDGAAAADSHAQLNAVLSDVVAYAEGVFAEEADPGRQEGLITQYQLQRWEQLAGSALSEDEKQHLVGTLALTSKGLLYWCRKSAAA